MARSLITVTDEENVETAMHVMADAGVSSVVVEPDANGAWGILTKRDIVTKIVNGDRNPATTKVGEIATRPVVSVAAEASVREAASLLSRRNFSRLTIEEGGRVIGMITEDDIFSTVERFGWSE
ncbi:CBS domain-containing protein [Algiphilus sp. W345]|uniref:CBS domain-containing protein n=2 Tax=Banduia mediterranea TaxID=3075609 RepID=A0ABU2WLI6_9GAMM|nr:CBS domain-containing protein [Algiphilus sp. W345]MDT0498418.1 CBS domain-containing protein [Algiphilus sp. W345]